MAPLAVKDCVIKAVLRQTTPDFSAQRKDMQGTTTEEETTEGKGKQLFLIRVGEGVNKILISIDNNEHDMNRLRQSSPLS